MVVKTEKLAEEMVFPCRYCGSAMGNIGPFVTDADVRTGRHLFQTMKQCPKCKMIELYEA